MATPGTTTSSASHPTLGQMADQIQERARADRLSRQGDDFEEELDEDEEGGEGEEGDDDDGEDVIPQGSESTGRWTRQEHELFLQALKKYGKEWKKVASMVKTRTVVQTRTHAQKYFQKLTKSTGGSINIGASGGSAHGHQSRDRDDEGEDGDEGDGDDGDTEDAGITSGGSSREAETRPKKSRGRYSDPRSRFSPKASDSPGQGITYMDTTEADYYDNLDVATLVSELHKTPAPPELHSLLLPEISSIPPPDFPEPSPAACGKRKYAELKAAQMLAASSTSSVPPPAAAILDNSPVPSALSQLVGSGREHSGSFGGSGSRRNRAGLTLSILDPDAGCLEALEGLGGGEGDPGTPWEGAVQALQEQQLSSNGVGTAWLTRGNSGSGSYTQAPVPVSTPSEQRSFISRVRALVREADLAGLANLLVAAEYSALNHQTEAGWVGVESKLTPVEEGLQGLGVVKVGQMEVSQSASNLMSAYTPEAQAFSSEPRGLEAQDKLSGACASELPELPVTPMTAELRRTEAINTHLNRSSGKERSLVAKSLNRIDRTSKSVLMEISTLEGNQTLLYSMTTLLLEHGASPSLVDGSGSTALHYAAARGYERVGRLLLTKGCPLNLQNLEGDTATHVAARAGNASFLEMLAKLGANFHIRNGASTGALDLAGVSGDRESLRRVMLEAEPRLRSLILYHEDFQEHTARRPSDWEGPDRLEGIMQRLKDRGEFPEHEVEISNQFEKADVVLLGRAHSAEYIGFVNMLSKHVQEEGLGPVLPFTPQIQRFVMRQASGELKSAEGSDTAFSAGTLKAARRAAGAVAHAVDRVLLGRNRNAFCAVRPPGHHAGYRGMLDGANSCGFCIFNSVAAGALHALEERQCERVAILDLDVHHGNGTEDIVRRYAHPSRLFFFSLHLFDKEQEDALVLDTQAQETRPIDCEEPGLPSPGEGGADAESGAAGIGAGAGSAGGAGAVGAGVAKASPSVPSKYEFYPGTGARDDHVHNIINVPLAPLWAVAETEDRASPTHIRMAGMLSGREGYRAAIEQRLIPSLRAFNPSLILLSSGFDAAEGDVGNQRHFSGQASRVGIDLQAEDYAWATTEVMKIADICCGGRLVSVLEGGYGEYAGVPPPRAATRARGGSMGAEEEAKKGGMDRSLLSRMCAAHVHRLIDPYRPAKHLP